eukprot:168313-Amphidinium_carterae.1
MDEKPFCVVEELSLAKKNNRDRLNKSCSLERCEREKRRVVDGCIHVQFLQPLVQEVLHGFMVDSPPTFV